MANRSRERPTFAKPVRFGLTKHVANGSITFQASRIVLLQERDRSAWLKARDLSIDEKLDVKSVHGAMSNVRYAALLAQWFPRMYNRWGDPSGAQRPIVDWHVFPDIVSATITESFFNFGLVEAADYYFGKGLENAKDIINPHRQIRNIKTKSDVNYKYKAATQTIMAACSRPAARRRITNPSHHDMCPRCGQAEATYFWFCWECECNA